MELKRYYYNRILINTHSCYGIVAKGLEKCPIGKVPLIGCACTHHDCCKGHEPHIRIVEKAFSWIQCEATTKMMEKDPTLGQYDTCVVE